MNYDVIIIGSGPAGLAAAIYAQRAELNCIVIEKNPLSGGQIINTYEVDNYPGTPGISGFDLSSKFREHCEKLNTTFITGEVVKFELEDNIKVVTLENGTQYRSKTAVIAAGGLPRHLMWREKKNFRDWECHIVPLVTEHFSGIRQLL